MVSNSSSFWGPCLSCVGSVIPIYFFCSCESVYMYTCTHTYEFSSFFSGQVQKRFWRKQREGLQHCDGYSWVAEAEEDPGANQQRRCCFSRYGAPLGCVSGWERSISECEAYLLLSGVQSAHKMCQLHLLKLCPQISSQLSLYSQPVIISIFLIKFEYL